MDWSENPSVRAGWGAECPVFGGDSMDGDTLNVFRSRVPCTVHREVSSG